MQTSLKRCGLKFSSRKDMSAKFPRGGGGGGGGRTFFSSKTKAISGHFAGAILPSENEEFRRT